MKEKPGEVEIRICFYSYESKSNDQKDFSDIILVWSAFVDYFPDLTFFLQVPLIRTRTLLQETRKMRYNSSIPASI